MSGILKYLFEVTHFIMISPFPFLSLLPHLPPASLLCSAQAEVRAADRRTVRKEDREKGAVLVDKLSVLGIRADASVHDSHKHHPGLRPRCYYACLQMTSSEGHCLRSHS